jgi:flavin-binding protein dodecin
MDTRLRQPSRRAVMSVYKVIDITGTTRDSQR